MDFGYWSQILVFRSCNPGTIVFKILSSIRVFSNSFVSVFYEALSNVLQVHMGFVQEVEKCIKNNVNIFATSTFTLAKVETILGTTVSCLSDDGHEKSARRQQKLYQDVYVSLCSQSLQPARRGY